MLRRPEVVAFDALGTVVDPLPLDQRMAQVHLRTGSVQLWFARVLRDGYALTMNKDYRPFPEVARHALAGIMHEQGVTPTPEAVEHVLSGIAQLPVYPDAAPAFRQVREAGAKVVVLTNGTRQMAEKGLRGAGLEEWVDQVISIDEVQRWKPHPEVYRHAMETMGVTPTRIALVAAHGWDVYGADREGWTTAWVDRLERSFNPIFGRPDVQAATLTGAAEQLLSTERRREAA